MTDQPKTYLEERWDSQKKYYSGKSGENKQKYEALQMITMIGAALVPVLITIDSISEYFPIAISVIVAISTGTERIKKYGDRWRAFRLASEGLKRERALYLAKAGGYRRTKSPDQLFAERCEDIIAAEVGMYFPDMDKEAQENNTIVS